MKPSHGPDSTTLSVGQFAKLVGASRSQLLYYDRRGIFQPALRAEAGQQAANRRYKLDQIFHYQVLNLYQQAGCSLEEASRYLNADWGGRSEFLLEQETRLNREIQRLQTLQESIILVLHMKQLVRGTQPDAPSFDTFTAPFPGIYHPIDPPCLRNTPRFAQLYIQHYLSVCGDPDVLPMPIIVTYSAAMTTDGRFPATGILSLLRKGTAQDRANYCLNAGRYLFLSLKGPIGAIGMPLMTTRLYQTNHHLQRATPIMACNMGVFGMSEASEAHYDECVFYEVREGETLRGEKAALPGVD